MAVDDSLEDRLSFSSGSDRGSRVWKAVPVRGVVGLRNLSLKCKRGDSSPHGPDR